MPRTKMKLQSYRDTLILTEAKCAISLKQWGSGEGGGGGGECSMIYLFVSSSSGKFFSKQNGGLKLTPFANYESALTMITIP